MCLFIFQIFQDGELTHYVDGAGDQRNWMKYVNCARHEGEQNLVLIQEEGELFYEVCMDIAEGSELLVWYGDTYLKYMGIPITMKTKLTKIESDGGLGMYITCTARACTIFKIEHQAKNNTINTLMDFFKCNMLSTFMLTEDTVNKQTNITNREEKFNNSQLDKVYPVSYLHSATKELKSRIP